MRRPFLLVVPCALAAQLAACGPLGSDSGTLGELGNGFFSYHCDAESDPMCDAGEGPLAMPKGIAVGARFTASYTPGATSEDQGSAVVEAASKEQLGNAAGLGSSFLALKPGVAGLLARRGTTVVDLYHLELAAIDHVRIETSDESGTPGTEVMELKLELGQTATLRALAVDPVNEQLAGAMECAWTSVDDTIAMVASTPTDNVIAVQGLQAGVTSLQVQLGETSAQIAVTVGEGLGGGGGAGGSGGSGGGGGSGGSGGDVGGAGGGA